MYFVLEDFKIRQHRAVFVMLPGALSPLQKTSCLDIAVLNDYIIAFLSTCTHPPAASAYVTVLAVM